MRSKGCLVRGYRIVGFTNYAWLANVFSAMPEFHDLSLELDEHTFEALQLFTEQGLVDGALDVNVTDEERSFGMRAKWRKMRVYVIEQTVAWRDKR